MVGVAKTRKPKARAKPHRKAAAKVKKTCRTVTKKVHGRKKRVKVCTPVKAKKPVAKKPAAKKPGSIGAKAPAAAIVAPAKAPAASQSPIPVVVATATERAMERLLWRAGFGPAPGQAAQLAGRPLADVVLSLTRPAGAANLVGPAPRDDDGNALAPYDVWGHDHLFWMDRMIRGDQPLVERMALIWHDWFATSLDGGPSQEQMLDQIDLFRSKGLGTFDDLLTAVTQDPAMLLWLNGTSNNKW